MLGSQDECTAFNPWHFEVDTNFAGGADKTKICTVIIFNNYLFVINYNYIIIWRHIL
jgi:hypothetical protein